MRHYELVTILSPMLSQDQATEAWGQINDFITNRSGDIFQEQPWGTRRLAYPIHRGAHHFLEGNYRLIRFSTETPFNQALENFLKFDERVLRSLVISIPDREILPDPVAARPAPAAATAPRPAGEGDATTASAEETAATETPEAATESATESAAETPAGAVVETAAGASEPVAAEADVAAAEAPVEESTAEAEPEAPVAEAETSAVAETAESAEAEAQPATDTPEHTEQSGA